MFSPEKVIIHHSLTKDSGTVSWGAIRKFHVEQLVWNDIGYHAGAELARDQFECLYGRPEIFPGAHCRGNNLTSLGFCFVGNYDIQEPALDMLAIAARLVLGPWCARYDIPVGLVLPHGSFSEKSCPGSMFPMDTLRDFITAAIGG